MQSDIQHERIPWYLALIFILLVCGIVFTGYMIFLSQRDEIQRNHEYELNAVADSKIRQLTAWRQERMGDANLILENSGLVNHMVRLVEDPTDTMGRREFLNWADSFIGHAGYSDLAIVDSLGNPVFTIPDVPHHFVMSSLRRSRIDAARTRDRVIFADFFRPDTADSTLRIEILIPLRLFRQTDTATVGVLVMGINPEAALGPLLASWPGQSHTAETFLVRSEDKGVRYLTPTRRAGRPRYWVWYPLTEPDLPAAAAIRGMEGNLTGKDQNSIPVIAVARHIHGSTWFLVAQVDRAEVFDEIAERGLLIGSVAILLSILSGLGLISLWRNHWLRFYRHQYEVEMQRHALETHYSSLTRYANDIILLMDNAWNIIDANERALESYGYSRPEITSLDFAKLHAPAAQKDFTSLTNALKTREGFVNETVHRRKDGSTFPVESSSRIMVMDGRTFVQVIIRDITERKEAAEAVRSAHAFLESILESSSAISIISTDLEGTILFWNTGAERMLGYTAEEVVGRMNASMLYRQDDEETRKRIRHLDQSVCKEQRTVTMEVQEVRRSGEVIWVKITVSPRLDENGDVVGLLGIGEDITERKQAEEEREQASRQLRLLAFTVNGARDCFCVTDLHNRILFANQAMLDTYGFMEEELLGKSVSMFYPGRNGVAHEILEKTRKGGWSGETMHRRKDGSEFPVELRTSVVCNDEGGPVALLAVARDITARKQTEDALSVQTAYFTQLFENSPQGIVIVDPKGRVLGLNRAFTSIFGYTLDEVRARPLREVIVPPHCQEEYEKLTNQLLQGDAVQRESVRRRKDGQYVDVAILGFPVRIRDKDVALYGVYTDISERKRTEKIQAAVYRISQAANSTDDLHELYGLIHRVLAEFMPAENFYIALYDSVTDIVSFPYFVDQTEPAPAPRKQGRGLTEYILRTGASRLVTPEIFKTLQAAGEVNHIGTTALDWLGVPLKVEDRVIGVMAVQSYTERVRFSQHETDLLQFISTQVAMAIVRKQAQEDLRLSKESAFALLNATGETLILTDTEGTILSINETGAKRMGKRVEELIGVNLYSLFDPALGARRRAYAHQAASTGTPVHFSDQRHEIHFETTIFPVRSENGSIERVVIFGQDVTKRREAEEKLRTLTRAIEQSPSSIIITDRHGNIEYVNPKFTNVTGYAPEEVLGHNPRILKSGKTSAEEYRKLWETVSAGKEWLGEFQNKKKNGDLFWEFASISPVTNSEGLITHFIAVKEDITELKNLEGQLRQAQKLESLGTLAGGIAHDVNNLLAIILAHASILQRRAPDAVRLSQSVDAITRAVQRGTGLVRQLLTFARKTEVQFQSLNVNNAIEELVKMLEETFPRTVTFSLALDRNIPEITADASQLHQALLNLCVNARDAMASEGTITMKTCLVGGKQLQAHYPGASEEPYVAISISDTGVGMSEETLRRIFEPFFTTKGVGKGTGLGLAVVYGIINSHHGFIDVDSEPDSGTTFNLYFPVPRSLAEQMDKPVQMNFDAPSGNETILVVEDEQMLLDLVKGLLESKGYTVLTAVDGLEAVQVYQEHYKEIALVLTDLGLPKLGGWEAVEQMQQVRPQLKIIVATGYLDPDAKTSMLAAGAKQFIQKPYVPAEVLRRIRETLDASAEVQV